jgi:glycosyltransferase involved in cell wall biosynthesis
MGKYKICVYAICKNEQKFVESWYNSVKDADKVIVVDTGSTDNTVHLLKEAGVTVYEKTFTPWRFDNARNYSLSLIPEDFDICICTDLDEIIEPNWREILERNWKKDTDRASYRYTWNFNADGSEGYVFWIDKIHSRKNFIWKNAVHEILVFTENRNCNYIYPEGIQVNHYSDPEKPRSQYLPLLELSQKENPEDDRITHYLGREYMYYQKWDKCIAMLFKHLSLPSATWKDERAASMRYIAKSFSAKGDDLNAKTWFYKSIAEAPYLREPYTDFANYLYTKGEWEGVIYMCKCALYITERSKSYINEADSWGFLPYDLLAIAYYNTANFKKALESSTTALTLSPLDERLINNDKFYREKIQSLK